MIAGTGAEHHCFAPVLALFELVKTAAKRRRESEGEAPSVGFGAKPQAGVGVATPSYSRLRKT